MTTSGAAPGPAFPSRRSSRHAQQITDLLDRHAAGDWGEISEDDRAANDEAARSGDGRLFSSYTTAEHGKVWIITDDIRGEGEGPITTVMFPEDY